MSCRLILVHSSSVRIVQTRSHCIWLTGSILVDANIVHSRFTSIDSLNNRCNWILISLWLQPKKSPALWNGSMSNADTVLSTGTDSAIVGSIFIFCTNLNVFKLEIELCAISCVPCIVTWVCVNYSVFYLTLAVCIRIIRISMCNLRPVKLLSSDDLVWRLVLKSRLNTALERDRAFHLGQIISERIACTKLPTFVLIIR